MKLALIQLTVYPTNKENIENALLRIKEASDNGADIVILPEMFCCPYETKNFPIFAQSEDGENVKIMSNCAKENNIYLVSGSMPENDNGKIYNTSYVFDRDGNKIGKHRKVHLFDIDVKGGQRFKESETLSAGENATIFETEFGKFGLLICFDIRFPEISRIIALKGAKALIIPAAFNMTTGPAHWELAFRSRAVDNQFFTVGVSPARDETGSYVAYGNSIVVSPWGKVVASLDEKDATLYYDMDLSEVDSIRTQLPQILKRKTNLYSLNYKTETY